MAWQSVVAVDCYIIAGIIQALIQLGHPEYDPTRWQATLLTVAAAVGLCLFNIFAASQLSLLEGVFAVCHVFLFVPIVVMLWILAPTSTPQEALFTFTNQGGWPSTALSLLIGQVPMIFTTLGSDSVAHLAEEVENAAVVVPQAMLWSYLVNAPLALLMALTIIFNIGPVENAIQSACPFVYMFETALQNTQATTAFTIVMLVLLAMVTVSVIASTSRQMFAFAYVPPSKPSFPSPTDREKKTRQRPPLLPLAQARKHPIQRPRQRHHSNRRLHRRPFPDQHRQHRRLQRRPQPFHNRADGILPHQHRMRHPQTSHERNITLHPVVVRQVWPPRQPYRVGLRYLEFLLGVLAHRVSRHSGEYELGMFDLPWFRSMGLRDVPAQ